MSRILRALPIILLTFAFLGGAFHTYHSYFGLWAKAPELPQFFNLDRLVPFEAARRIVKTEQKLIFVGGNDYDDQWVYPWLRFIFSNQPEEMYIRTFDYKRTIVFPADHASANYLFTFDLPLASIMKNTSTRSRLESLALHRQAALLRCTVSKTPDLHSSRRWPVPSRFGNQILVHGFDMPKDARAGEVMTVRWYWQILATDDRELAFTNQLFGWDDRRRRQLDDRAFAPGYWPAGTSGITTFEIDIDPETPTGAYWLRVATYDRGRPDTPSLPVFDAQGNEAGSFLRLGPIKVHGRPPAPCLRGTASNPAGASITSCRCASPIRSIS